MNLATQNAPATLRQLWALFVGTGLKTDKLTISINKASNLISNMKNGVDITQDLYDLGATGTPKKKPEDFRNLYNKAHNAGMEAVSNLQVIPMIVQERTNPLNDNSPVKQQYFVADGVCGFAEIRFPGNTAFAKWCIKNNLCKKSYNGGYFIWVSQFNQSMQKKEAYASAFAKVLQEAGIKAYSASRMD